MLKYIIFLLRLVNCWLRFELLFNSYNFLNDKLIIRNVGLYPWQSKSAKNYYLEICKRMVVWDRMCQKCLKVQMNVKLWFIKVKKIEEQGKVRIV